MSIVSLVHLRIRMSLMARSPPELPTGTVAPHLREFGDERTSGLGLVHLADRGSPVLQGVAVRSAAFYARGMGGLASVDAGPGREPPSVTLLLFVTLTCQQFHISTRRGYVVADPMIK